MFNKFEEDEHPGKPKILFIGLVESTHTHAWIDLLNGSNFNVRLFALPSGCPSDDFSIRTYNTSPFNKYSTVLPNTRISQISLSSKLLTLDGENFHDVNWIVLVGNVQPTYQLRWSQLFSDDDADC